MSTISLNTSSLLDGMTVRTVSLIPRDEVRTVAPTVTSIERGIIAKSFSIDYSSPLGGGVKSTVYTAVHDDLDERLSVKIVPLARPVGSSPKEWSKVINGLTYVNQVWCMLKHPNVVKMRGASSDKDNYYFYMDYFDGGDLYKLINRYDHLNECLIYVIFRQMMEGLKYMHDELVIHRNIKLENIVWDTTHNFNVALSGLGNATKIDGHMSNLKDMRKVGSLDYIPPEYYFHDDKTPINLKAIDIWACGVCLYILSEGKFPYNVKGNKNGMDPYDAKLTFTRVSPELRDLIEGMLSKRFRHRCADDEVHDHRFSVEEVLNHPWCKIWDSKFRKGFGCSPEHGVTVGKDAKGTSYTKTNPSLPWYSTTHKDFVSVSHYIFENGNPKDVENFEDKTNSFYSGSGF